MREYQVRHATLEERVCIDERRLAELQGASGCILVVSRTIECSSLQVEPVLLVVDNHKALFAYECRINSKNLVATLLVKSVC